MNDPARTAEETERFEQLFLNEASLAGKLHHPNIVAVYDADVDGDTRYIVMEYVAGGSLKQYCLPDHLLPVRKVAQLVFKLCRALDYAERSGVIHRDVKSANILFAEDGEVKISDFGAAHITEAGVAQVHGFVGSPAYMAPEVINEAPSSVQADIWSLGVVMYELLAGRLPYSGSSLTDLLGNIVEEDYPPLENQRPDVPASLAAVVRRALTKPLEQRFRNWFEMARALIECFRELDALGDELTVSEKLSRLRAVDFFQSFRDEELREVVKTARWETCRRGAPVAVESEADPAFYVLVSGQAKVARDGHFVAALLPGDCFGEISPGTVMPVEPGTSVIAVSEVECVRLQATTLEQLTEGCQLRFTRQFLGRLIARLSSAHEARQPARSADTAC